MKVGVIGAGMSGLAASIRLAMLGHEVTLLEKHSIAGGLNSYYKRGKRHFDTGLHALTNFAIPKKSFSPLLKVLRQLRIPYKDLELKEQNFSQVVFGESHFEMHNDWEKTFASIIELFPAQEENLKELTKEIRRRGYNIQEGDLASAKDWLAKRITDPLCAQMLICPILVYGSPWECDLTIRQFTIMFHSLFLEGFSRPARGVVQLIELLEKKALDLGVELNYKTGVDKIIQKDTGFLIIDDKAKEHHLDKVFSCAGLPETMKLFENSETEFPQEKLGKMSFLETLLVTPKPAYDYDINSNVVFYNSSSSYSYQNPTEPFDFSSAVLCFPDNYKGSWNGMKDGEGIMRVTFMANNEYWHHLKTSSKAEYKAMKEVVASKAVDLLKSLYPQFNGEYLFKDVFSPDTITRYTGHHKGTVYGVEEKAYDGRTAVENLYVMGNDQGFVGVVGAMLSGITIANLWGGMKL